jgi:hypothetical protein
MRRAERILWIAETIAAQAQRDDDARLALQAVDRARSSLETMMRATGLIGGDATVTVNVDYGKQVVQLFESFPETTVRALQRGECQHCRKSLLEPGITTPALTSGKSQGLPSETVPSSQDAV